MWYWTTIYYTKYCKKWYFKVTRKWQKDKEENKGEKIAFCLNRKKEGGQLIDLNTLTFVAIHELAHVMTKEEGHKLVFWQNFKFLLENAKEANIYQPVNYKQTPKEYCGMKITDNPYYDLKWRKSKFVSLIKF